MPRMTAGKRSELESFWRVTSHMTKGAVPAPASHIPSTRSMPPGKRRRFSEAGGVSSRRPTFLAHRWTHARGSL